MRKQPWGCLLAVVALALILPAAAGAEVCDDLADLADAWDELATLVDEAGGLGEEGEAALIDMLDGTGEVAGALQEAGVELGGELGLRVAAVADSDTVDGLLDAMDGVIDTLDALVDDCDAAAETPPAGDGGRIVVRYEPAPVPEAEPLVALIAGSGLFEAIAEDVGAFLVLPADVDTLFTSCGVPNAFFDPEAGRVVMCYEFFALFEQIFSDPETDPEETAEAVLGVGAFFYLHELGHALVHHLELPITGREEDAVDNLATLLLIHAEADAAALAAVENFAALADLAAEQEELAFWDEHSLDAQRLYDVACMVYGSDPETYAALVAPELLPPERAERCPGEFEQKDRAWGELLDPWIAGG